MSLDNLASKFHANYEGDGYRVNVLTQSEELVYWFTDDNNGMAFADACKSRANEFGVDMVEFRNPYTKKTSEIFYRGE